MLGIIFRGYSIFRRLQGKIGHISSGKVLIENFVSYPNGMICVKPFDGVIINLNLSYPINGYRHHYCHYRQHYARVSIGDTTGQAQRPGHDQVGVDPVLF